MRFSFLALIALMTVPAFAVAVIALPSAPARAQAKVEDQAQTFYAGRQRHLRAMEEKPERWWRGDMADRGLVSATNPKINPDSGNRPGIDNVNNPAGNPLTRAPGTENARSPAEVQPFFSFEQMLDAHQPQDGPDSPAGNGGEMLESRDPNPF